MRLIDADEMKITGYMRLSGYTVTNRLIDKVVDSVPTVKAVPIEALYDLRDELQKEADRQSLITASDLNIAINRIDAKIRQIEGE